MRKILSSSVAILDHRISILHRNLFGEKNGLISFLFHALSDDEDETGAANVDPLLQVKQAAFRKFCGNLSNSGYEFISPEPIVNGLDANKKYLLITFDDGYYNNRLALPVLEEFNIPAVFFISPHYVMENRSYWWDVVYREVSKRKVPKKDFYALQDRLKKKKIREVNDYITENFGQKASDPIGDGDRPFSEQELKEFARHPLVHIGNHTDNHEILTNCSRDEIRREISDAQVNLESISGKTPEIISYPNGNVSSLILDVAKEVGLKLGVTAFGQKNLLPLKENDLLLIHRFGVHNGNIESIVDTSRSDNQQLSTILMQKNRSIYEDRMFN